MIAFLLGSETALAERRASSAADAAVIAARSSGDGVRPPPSSTHRHPGRQPYAVDDRGGLSGNRTGSALAGAPGKTRWRSVRPAGGGSDGAESEVVGAAGGRPRTGRVESWSRRGRGRLVRCLREAGDRLQDRVGGPGERRPGSRRWSCPAAWQAFDGDELQQVAPAVQGDPAPAGERRVEQADRGVPPDEALAGHVADPAVERRACAGAAPSEARSASSPMVQVSLIPP